MEERSHIGASSVQFVNDLVKDVCLKGKSLKNYRSDVGRFFPGNGDIFGQIEEFVDAVDSAKSGKTEVDAAFLELRTLPAYLFDERYCECRSRAPPVVGAEARTCRRQAGNNQHHGSKNKSSSACKEGEKQEDALHRTLPDYCCGAADSLL